MDSAELRDTTRCRDNRRLRRMSVTDAEQAGAAFDPCMGEDVAPRRAFIIDEGGLLNEGLIDA
jgi:DNA gyrase subunit B